MIQKHFMCLLLGIMLGCGAEPKTIVKEPKTGPLDIHELVFDAPVLWDEPLADYQEAASAHLGHEDYLKGIHDLTVFDDQLYMAYGDANLNLGRVIPLESRYWEGPQPGSWQSDFIFDEEQISHFRVVTLNGDDVLMAPGVDATEDAFIGNVYSRWPAETWNKSRTLTHAIHVHDVATVGDQLFACGSGGSQGEYQQGKIHGLLFLGTPDAAVFEQVFRVENPDLPGDARLTHLLGVADKLYAFGYYSSFEANAITGFYALEWLNNALEPFSDLESVMVTHTYNITPNLGLISGIDIQDGEATVAHWAMDAEGLSPLSALEGHTIVDAMPLAGDRLLLLVLPQATYPVSWAAAQAVEVLVLDANLERTTLLSFEAESPLESIAFWRESLFLGGEDGSLWRTEGR